MQMDITRRDAMIASAALTAASLIGVPRAYAAGEATKLPAPRTEGGIPLMQALAKRQSIRAYDERPLDQQTMSDLLWAAFGVNRPETGDRTAPSWRHSLETNIYVCTAGGVSAYEPKAHTLQRMLDLDIRRQSSAMVFAATAPVVLVYTADFSRMAKAPRNQQVPMAYVDSALIGENVYLFCASAGLGTVILGTVEREGLAKLLRLPEDQMVTFAQPVGYPK